MLFLIGLTSVIYVLLSGREQVSREVGTVIFLVFAYLSYSFIWSGISVLYVRANLNGGYSNFSYSMESVVEAYAITLSGLSIAVAVYTFLAGRIWLQRFYRRKRTSKLDAATPFVCAMLITAYGGFSLMQALLASGFSAVDARHAEVDHIGYSCQHIFGLPLALAMLSGDKVHLRFAQVAVGMMVLLGVFSGRTTFVAVGLAPVLVVYLLKFPLTWRGIGRAFGAIVLALMVLQLYRTMRTLGASSAQSSALQIQNSFTEILVLSRVADKVSLRESYTGTDSLLAAFFPIVPGAVAGAEKAYYAPFKTDLYVSERFFDSDARTPITIYGDGFLMAGQWGVIGSGILVGVVLCFAHFSFLTRSAGGASGLVIISAIVYSTRMGLSELTVTLVCGLGALWVAGMLRGILWPSKSLPQGVGARSVVER